MKAPTTSIIAGIALTQAGPLSLPDALRPDAAAVVRPVRHAGVPATDLMNPGTR